MNVLTPLAIELDLIMRLKEGAASVTRMAAIASTTINSIRVKPRSFCMARSVALKKRSLPVLRTDGRIDLIDGEGPVSLGSRCRAVLRSHKAR